jgi:hypothetical protein
MCLRQFRIALKAGAAVFDHRYGLRFSNIDVMFGVRTP